MNPVFVWKVRFLLAALGSMLAFGLPVASQSVKAPCEAQVQPRCTVEASARSSRPRPVRVATHKNQQPHYLARLHNPAALARP